MDMEYLLWLQNLRGGALDNILLYVTDFIASPVMYVFIAIIYWCINKRSAIYLAMNISFGSMINQTLKNTFCIYRPWIKNPDIIPLESAKESATGYSFPSGHTQIASSEFLSIAIWQKDRKWVVGLCIFMTLLIMFTRNYLGVHTPQDVIVSLLISLIVIYFNYKLINWIDSGKNRDITVFLTGIVTALIVLIYVTLKPYPLEYSPDGSLLVNPSEMIIDCYMAAGCVTGFLIGWICERRIVNFTMINNRKMLVVRAVTGSIILLVYALFARTPLSLFHPYWGEFIYIALAFIYILFLHPLMFTSWEKRRKKNG